MTESDAVGMDSRITADEFLGGRVRLLQWAEGYRAAVDPVLLAATVPALAGDRVLELGCGAGAAMLCLAVRVPGLRVDGLEVQPDTAALARRNVDINALADRVAVHEGTILDPPGTLPRGVYDRVMMNPPFHPAGAHTGSPEPGKALSHGEGEAVLGDWVRAALWFLKARGTLTLIHRADRLDEILFHLRGRFGAVTVFPLWPKAGMAAKRVLVHARRGVRTPLRLAPGLVLHEADGRFTPVAEAVLRQGNGLDIQRGDAANPGGGKSA